MRDSDIPPFNPRSDAKPTQRVVIDDDAPCEKCGAVSVLDTGLECTVCGHDNWLALTGKPFLAARPGEQG